MFKVSFSLCTCNVYSSFPGAELVVGLWDQVKTGEGVAGQVLVTEDWEASSMEGVMYAALVGVFRGQAGVGKSRRPWW